METINKITAIGLLDQAKNCKNHSDFDNLVNEWVNTRKDNDLEPALKWASLSGILQANISMLIKHIIELEKTKP